MYSRQTLSKRLSTTKFRKEARYTHIFMIRTIPFPWKAVVACFLNQGFFTATKTISYSRMLTLMRSLKAHCLCTTSARVARLLISKALKSYCRRHVQARKLLRAQKVKLISSSQILSSAWHFSILNLIRLTVRLLLKTLASTRAFNENSSAKSISVVKLVCKRLTLAKK